MNTSTTQPPAPQLALIADDLYSFAQIEEAWGDVVPLPRVHFDAFRTQLGKLREFYSKCSPVVDPATQSRPEAELPEVTDEMVERAASAWVKAWGDTNGPSYENMMLSDKANIASHARAALQAAYGQQCAATRPAEVGGDSEIVDFMEANPDAIRRTLGYRDHRDSWSTRDSDGGAYDFDTLREAVTFAIKNTPPAPGSEPDALQHKHEMGPPKSGSEVKS